MAELFTAESLIDEACRETGLDDFGPWAWRDGLEALMEGALAEADLNVAGLGILKSWSLRRLVNRLCVIDWVKRPRRLKMPIRPT